MPGFFVSNIAKCDISNDAPRVREEMREGLFWCARSTLSKFMDDKAFYVDDRYVVIAEGVLLNWSELTGGGSPRNMAQFLIGQYEEYGEAFFQRFRGSFSGAIYDKKADKWVFYVNHYGDNALFYYRSPDGRFAIGSQVNYVLDCLRDAGVGITLNEAAITAMLTYGFMFDNGTYANEIQRLLPGSYIVLAHGDWRIKRYWRIKEHSVEIPSDEREIIAELDRLFRQAIRREFDKDLEYGYTHLCDLSGGLDSRMVSWVAKDMGYTPVLNLTYSQSGYLDERIAEEVSAKLGNDLLFKSLDSARFLLDAEHLVSMNWGLSLYSGITGGESLLRALDMASYGLEHTGQIGDVVVGTFIGDPSLQHSIEHAGMYSAKLQDALPALDCGLWLDREQFLFETRAFLGALATHFIRRNYTEVASPFLDVDFLDYCMGIPVELRAGHRLYKKWIITCYPEAADITWEKEGVPPSAPRLLVLGRKATRRAVQIARRAVPSGRRAVKVGMNPLDYWYRTKPWLREWMANQASVSRPSLSPKLELAIDDLMRDGTVLEKTQAITVLYSLRYYFGENSTTDGVR